jgi:hypothetical protein
MICSFGIHKQGFCLYVAHKNYLSELIINPALQRQILTVQFGRWNNPWAHWTERVTTFAQKPLQTIRNMTHKARSDDMSD